MNKRILLSCSCCLLLAGALWAQTDEQYAAALQAITPEATYRIYTMNNGEREGAARYFLTSDGRLTNTSASAGSFTFHRMEGDELFRSPGWQFDQFFTNPDCWDGQTEWMYNEGHLRTNASLARPDWEGQVWFKEGLTYAVRATNANVDASQWGSNTYWTVVPDMDGDGLPDADYSLSPSFTWRLEKIAEPGPGNTDDPSVKDVRRLTNLPHLYLETFNKRSITSKSTYVLARLWYVDEQDSVAFFDSLEVRGRGNSTWNMEKKPYKLKFHQKEKLLGRGYARAKKWTLMANHGDKSLMRNALTSRMGERAGLPFNPAAKFVDLTLNDVYVGNYQLSDQVEVRAHRVDVEEQDVPVTAASDITGGYLLEADGFADFHRSSYWDNSLQRYLPADGFYTTRASVPVRIHYPDADELDESQTNYIRDHVQDFEQRLYGRDFTDPLAGYRPLVDSTTLANWYLCTEMSGNVDGFYSTYFYKERQDSRLYWGPLWDYDIAYNNDNRSREGTSNTLQQLMSDAGYGALRSWVRRMWDDPWFARLINRRYAEILGDGMEDYLLEQIDSLGQLLAESAERNYARWGINRRTLRERVLYSTYEEYLDDLRSYVHDHLQFLEGAFAAYLPEPQPLPEPKQPDFPADPGCYYAISNAGTGTCVDFDAGSYGVCARARDGESQSQQWQILPLSGGYLFILNRATGLALNDPTVGNPTATTQTGTQFNLARADSFDVRQHWDLVAQSGERYNLVNRFSGHAANLSGGNAADGTPVLSYTSDERNSSSNNRLWRVEAVGRVGEDGLQGLPADLDYALAYDPVTRRLHFGAGRLADLQFAVQVYDSNGRLLRTFRAADGCQLSTLPRGLYVVAWTVNGRRRSVKFNI